MNDKNVFQELINKTMESAVNQNHKIDVKKVQEIFQVMNLSESQLEQVYKYLTENKISVTGYLNSVNSMDFEEEYIPKDINSKDSIYLSMYYEDLEQIKNVTKDEELSLFQKMKKGDNSARDRFIELNLAKAAEIAVEYKNRGMTAEDLIQEGNIALMESLDVISYYDDLDKAKEFIYNYIRKKIYELLKQQQSSDDFEYKVIEKSNIIFDALKELEEETGKKASIHELAEYMKLSEEEIKYTIELSGDALDLGNGREGAK